MELPEYTLSPETTRALEEAFKPFMMERVGYDRPTYVSRHLNTKDLAPDRVALVRTLRRTLRTQGGEEGQAILHAVEGMMHGGGHPAFVIHGLPTDGANTQGITQVVGEAFRQLLGSDKEYLKPERLGDRISDYKLEGFKPDGITSLHHDKYDFTLLYGIEGGTNPRHTPVYTAEALARHMVMLCEYDPRKRDALLQDFLELFQLPIWKVGDSKHNRFDETQQGLIRHSQGWFNAANYSPLIYPNPNHVPGEAGSCAYKFFQVPLTHIRDRVPVDKAKVPWHLRKSMRKLTPYFHYALMQPNESLEGPVLDTGDMLVMDNARVIHSGGPFVKAVMEKDAKRVPRLISAFDVASDRRSEFFAGSAENWADTIAQQPRAGREL